MILKFSNELKCDKEECSKNNLDWKKCCRWLNMRRNMMNLMMRDELNSEGQFFNKSNSQKDFELPKKIKKDKKENKNEEIVKNQHDNIYINLNSNDEKNIVNKDIQIGQIKKIINKKNNVIEEKGNEKNEIKENLNLNEQKSDNIIQKDDELNLKIQNSNDSNLENIGNIKNDSQINDSNNKAQSISNNPISNFFGIGNNMNVSPLNQLETFSLDSNNENSKNLKNKRNSFHSSSSLGKNFILKTEIYKSTNQKGNQYKKNNYSDNPIMNYYSGKNIAKFTNFYMADIKSSEEIDENHYINFFPNKDNNTKDKEYITYSPMENIRNDIIKESDNIFEEDNLDEKIKLDKSNLINNDSLEKKFNIDFINDTSMIEENPNNYNQNNIQIDIKNINGNIKDKNFNINNNENYNFNNINYNKEFRFPLNQPKNINNNNPIQFDFNNINKFNNNNTMNNLNNMNNQNIFSYNNNNMFNINNINNLKDFNLNKEILDEMSKIDLNKINLNFQGGNNYQIPNNYFIPVQNENNNSNMKFNYIAYNNKDMTLNGLPSGKSFYEYSDEDIIKYAIPLIKDQSGCRFLQERIKLNKSFMIEKLFPAIQSHLYELGCDAFGNYFLQALIDIFSVDNLTLFLDLIRNFFTKMCTDQHGTRVIQKIIEQVSLNQTLVAKIENILNCKDLGIIMKSPYGNHIIQKYIISIRFKEYTKFIYDYIILNFMEIAETKHGVCVIQKCVSEGDIIQKGKLYDLILQNFDELIKNEFGNYLIQYILMNVSDQNKFNEASPIIKRIEDNLIDICKMKFSANVIEKCLENGGNYIKDYLLECILNKYRDHVIELLLDKYGIYIIQKALKINTLYRNKFYEIIKEKKDELNNIDLNDFKYRGAQKVINSFKDFEIKNQNNTNKDINDNINNDFNGNYNNFYNYNADYRNNYNNKRKNKRGKKNFRGK